MNLLDRSQIKAALSESTHIVNCSRGADQVMLEGLRNLVTAALDNRVQKLVHLSSVAVYGDPPPAAAEHESAPTMPAAGSYGSIKLAQDRIVQRGAARGLPSIILCPPNIIGPYSAYLLDVLGSLVKDEFRLLDDGGAICNTVDARNLAHACVLALDTGIGDGGRYFITDDEHVTWSRLLDALRSAADIEREPQKISLSELQSLAKSPPPPRISLWKSFKHLVSSDVRSALRKDPLLERIDIGARRLVASFGSRIEDRMRTSIEGRPRIPAGASGATTNVRLSAQQLRGVYHSCELARTALGYRPLFGFDASMDAFARWLRKTRGMDEEDWNLARLLYGYG
jgi:nucleoside-diphosphate-sugar epimerase